MVAVVAQVTAFGRSGLADFLMQRISALIMLLYGAWLLGWVLGNPGFGHLQWRALFACPFMQVATSMVLLLLLAHSWIGLWGVMTDYLTARLLGPWADGLRLVLQLGLILLLAALALFGLGLVWSL